MNVLKLQSFAGLCSGRAKFLNLHFSSTLLHKAVPLAFVILFVS